MASRVTSVTLVVVCAFILQTRRHNTAPRGDHGSPQIFGLAGLFGLFVSALPMFLGIAFAIRPNERRLALMRPVTLAGIFAAIANTFLGITNALVFVARACAGRAAGPATRPRAGRNVGAAVRRVRVPDDCLALCSCRNEKTAVASTPR